MAFILKGEADAYIIWESIPAREAFRHARGLDAGHGFRGDNGLSARTCAAGGRGV
jgi:hypothetical protein